MVKLKVADYARWKPIFEAEGVTRQAGGSQGGHVFRSADDPNEVVLLLEWELELARQWSQQEAVSAKLPATARLGPPECYFLEEIEQFFR